MTVTLLYLRYRRQISANAKYVECVREGDYVYIGKWVSFCLRPRVLLSDDVYSVLPLIVGVHYHPPPDFSLSFVFSLFYLRGKER